MLELQNVKVRRSGKLLLDVPSLKIDSRATLLLGVNGAGKSTLLSILAGRLAPSAGRVTGSKSVISVEQQFKPIIGFTCVEYCAYVGWLGGQAWSVVREKASYWLEFVGIEHLMHQRCEKLSGGERSRLAIATALNSGADMLLLDEPSAALDPVSKQAISDLYCQIVEYGQSLLVSTHDSADLKFPFERVIVLDAGQVRFDGSCAEFQDLSLQQGDSPAHILSKAFKKRERR